MVQAGICFILRSNSFSTLVYDIVIDMSYLGGDEVSRVLNHVHAIWNRFNNLSQKEKLDFDFLKELIVNKIKQKGNITINKKDLNIEKEDIGRHIKWECIIIKVNNQRIILPLETSDEILERTNRKDNDTIGEKFNELNWVLPPFQPRDELLKIYSDNSKKNEIIKKIYSKKYVSNMVINKYSKLKYLKEYNSIIKECVEGFYFGLTKVAIIGLLPVIDGILSKMIEGIGEEIEDTHVEENLNLFDLPKKITKKALNQWEKVLFRGAWIDDKYKMKQFLRKIDETADVIISFQKYCEEYLFKNTRHLNKKTYLNRHLILHLTSHDKEINYRKEINKEINFYVLISLIDCLAFINCCFENGELGSFFAPDSTKQSINYNVYLNQLEKNKR